MANSKHEVLRKRYEEIYTLNMKESLYHNLKLLPYINDNAVVKAYREAGANFYRYQVAMSHRAFYFGIFDCSMVGLFKALNRSLKDISLNARLSSDMPLGISVNSGAVIFAIGLPREIWEMVTYEEVMNVTGDNQVGMGMKNNGLEASYIDLSEDFPNMMIGGETRSGKTIAHLGLNATFTSKMKAITCNIDVSQKKGRSGKNDIRIPSWTTFDNSNKNLSGKVVTTVEDAQKFLALGAYEIGLRSDYPERFDNLGRVVFNVDEADDLFSDPICEQLLNTIITKGAASGVNAIVATQHPLTGTFGKEKGSTIKRNLAYRLCGRVSDTEASRVILGGSRDDFFSGDQLNGYGDMLFKSPIHGMSRITTPNLVTADIEAVLTYGEPSLPVTEIYNEDININDILDEVINGKLDKAASKNVAKEIQPRHVGRLIARYIDKGAVGSDQTVRKYWKTQFPDEDEHPGGKYNQRIIDFVKDVIEWAQLEPCSK